jgi:magnesium-transporting ATPase (P-type)
MFFEVLVHFRMAHQIRDLYEEIEGPKVKVIRDGVKQKIKAKVPSPLPLLFQPSILMLNGQDTVVGDVVFLYAGAIVPCDGIFLTGRGVACDESKREGTRPGAGTIRKVSMEHIARMMYHADPRVRYSDCFMHSGDRVLEGSGRYVVTAISNEEMDPLRK